jgi:hypothetical protein
VRKQLNEDAIANELRGGSLFFSKPAQPASQSPQPQVPANVPMAPSPLVTKVTNGQGDKPTNHLVTKAPSHHPVEAATPTPAIDLSLSEREYFRCSIQEVEAIEDLKTKLRRDLGIHTSKQDIERFAVQRAVTEYGEVGEKSLLVTTLRKQPKR